MIYPMVRKYMLFLLLMLPLFLGLHAQENIPKVSAYVTDKAGVLTQQELQALNTRIGRFTDTTSNQIAVYITNDIGRNTIDEFTIAFGHKNGVGRKDLDNGIAMVVIPKTRNQRGQVFMATGYGLEGAIPDAIAKRIVDNEIIPNFKRGNYYQGISQGLGVAMKLAAGEISVKQYKKKTGGKGKKAIPVILIVLFIFLFGFFGKARSARRYAAANDLPFWVALGMMSSSSRSHGGYYNNFTSGGGSFGGGGGGFGGFGGGGFGGGGAGGSW